jgi:hypothetical protein
MLGHPPDAGLLLFRALPQPGRVYAALDPERPACTISVP